MRLIDRWRIEQSRTIPALRRYRISVDKVRRMGVEQLSNRLNKKRLVIRRRHDSALDRRRHLFSGGKISTARYAIHDSIKPRALRRIAIDCSERKPTLRIPEGRSLEFSNFGHACFLTCRGVFHVQACLQAIHPARGGNELLHFDRCRHRRDASLPRASRSRRRKFRISDCLVRFRRSRKRRRP